MSELEREIASFEKQKSELERLYLGKWALVHDESLAGTYDSFEQAATGGVQRFCRGPFLIRQVGAPPLTLPASVMD